jgi:uncharacterized membrane protein
MAPWLKIQLIKFIVRKVKEKRMFKGKLTYSAVAALLAVQVGKLLGVEVLEADVAAVTEAVLAVVALYGRWRATRA